MDSVKSKKKIIISISIIAIIGIVGATFAFANSKTEVPAFAFEDNTTKAVKGNIKVEISGSGILEPIESKDITALVNGKIINSPFKEGDMVKKDDILYKIEATDLEANIQKTFNAISRLELNTKDVVDNLNKTIIYAGADGRLTNFNVKVNDNITGSKLGEIVNDYISIAKVPFNENQINQISIGQAATVYSGTLMSSIDGTVTKISSYSSKKSNGSVLYTVEITIKGNTSLVKDSEVTAVIGGLESPEAGKIDVPESYSVTSGLAGRVKKVYVSNNDYVTNGQKLIELEENIYTSAINKSSLDKSDLEVSLQTLRKQLENYTLKAPIDGKILVKNKELNDTINIGANPQPLMVVADISKMKFNMKVDELDINNVKIGQKVTVTADSLSDKTFNGQVTSINGKGTVVNGVSYFQVEVTINEPGELKAGMNVNGKIIVSEKNNILTVPVKALIKKDNKTFVYLPSDDKSKLKEISVQTGLKNMDSIEIVSGLKEGDVIVIPQLARTNIGE